MHANFWRMINRPKGIRAWWARGERRPDWCYGGHVAGMREGGDLRSRVLIVEAELKSWVADRLVPPQACSGSASSVHKVWPRLDER